MKVVKYILGILFIFTSLGAITQGAFLVFLFLMILGGVLLPPISYLLKEKFKLWQSKWVRYVTYAILFFIAGVFVPKETSIIKPATKNFKQEQNVNDTLNLINYKIQKEAVIRFDKGPSYFVLIDKIDLSNNKFKEDIKNLVNKIVTENGAKINIEIIDDKNTLELMYKSHYGVNILGRILNKDEIEQLKENFIASFSGELETDYQAYFNTLYFFPCASKESSKFGKYVETIEYNPIVKDAPLEKRQRQDFQKMTKELNKKKENFKKNCFSTLHGYNRELVKFVKNKMNDKKSFEHVDTSYTLLDDYAVVIMEFRGKNSFGALVLNSVKAKISYDCEVLEIVE